jgi:hypothetical protein
MASTSSTWICLSTVFSWSTKNKKTKPKSITEQQSAKERAKENLGRSYGQKRRAEDIDNSDFDEDEDEDDNTVEPADSATVPPAENPTPARLRPGTTARSESNSRSRGRNNPKRQQTGLLNKRWLTGLHARTEGGASELASAMYQRDSSRAGGLKQ